MSSETDKVENIDFTEFFLNELVSNTLAGFYTKEELFERYSEEVEEESQELLKAVLDSLWDGHSRRIQAIPPEDNSYLKLKSAFEKLNEEGVVAEMNYSCCGSCGHYELRSDYRDSGKKGYVFFNEQSGSSIPQTGRVYLGHGTLPSYSPMDDIELGRLVVRALEEKGLDTEWDGTAESTIVVELPLWGKPLP